MPVSRRRLILSMPACLGTLGHVSTVGSASAQSVRNQPIPKLTITPDAAARVGRQVWINESNGRPEGVTAWNHAEDFPSLGIGHWIWFKAGGNPQFEESFPKLVDFIRARGVIPPAWLDKRPVPPCPWPDRAAFMRDFQSPRMMELRKFLLDSVPQQTEYLLRRTEAAIPKMLEALATEHERSHLLAQLNRLVASSPDLYPLIDYVNFKGEGISQKETTFDPPTNRSQGWGLRWLLIEMQGIERGLPALAEFSRAAKYVLDRRIRNNPASARWREGWHKRCDTYKRPLS